MPKRNISVSVNGQRHELEVEANQTLLKFLRDDLGLTGTKCGCDRGDCGVCTVLLDGVPVKSCLVLAVETNGLEVTTIEGLAGDGKLTALQKAFVDHGAIQCGFCTPAFVLVGGYLLRKNHELTEEDVKDAINGILCRCTGYRQIIDAIISVSKARNEFIPPR